MVYNTDTQVAVVGGGPVGVLAAIYLARRGYRVDVYERLGDMRIETIERRRSISLTLAARGLRALDEVGLKETVLAHTIPLGGRVVHTTAGTSMYHPYGKNKTELIHAIRRDELCRVMIEAAQAYPTIQMHFHQHCLAVDKAHNLLTFRDERTGREQHVSAQLIIGADGAYSTVRQQMHRGERANFRQEYLEWGYRELIVPPASPGKHRMQKHALHIWPRGERLILALPSLDGTFTCTCILPFAGPDSFATLTSEPQVRAFFAAQFPDLLQQTPNLVTQFLTKDISTFVTTNVCPWHFRDRIVLVGDACHAMFPFYGQGLNAGMEDCATLDACIEQHPQSLEGAFSHYEALRKRNTDTLTELSKANFVELRDTARSPRLTARKQVNVALNTLFPNRWIPLYTMITHTTMPCADALQRSRKQDRIARLLGIDVLVLGVTGVLLLKRALSTVSPVARRRAVAPSLETPRPMVVAGTRSRAGSSAAIMPSDRRRSPLSPARPHAPLTLRTIPQPQAHALAVEEPTNAAIVS